MIKTILVAATGTEKTKAALETAATVARLFGSHIECLRIHRDPAQVMAQAASSDMGSGLVMPQLVQALQEEDGRRTKVARKAFDAICKQENWALAESPPARQGASAVWREETGDEVSRLVKRAHFNDLVVIENLLDGGGLPRGAAGELLFGGGRPILIAPRESRKSLTRSIVIAWKETPEAAGAVSAAMPLLAKAEQILVVSASEGADSEPATRLSLNNAVDHLRWHNLPAEGRYLDLSDLNAPEAILAEALRIEADLVVMGGYGHSRMREFIFGGFTRRVLNGCALPVFAYH